MESPGAITKILLPSRRSSLLHRPRLVDFIHGHVDRKLILVSASAGYGKTSLLIDFAHETALPVCWYSLDASDADPKSFLDYMIASLRRQFPQLGSRTLGLLASSTLPGDSEVVVGSLVTEIHESIPGYFVLILDDFHTVETSASVNHILDALLRLLPENAHVVLASRTLPSRLTLTRLTAHQEIAGLGVNDLRFTAQEIRELTRQNYQVELSDTDAAALAEHSEGWIAGILLTTHSLWRGLFQDLVRLQGTHSNVFDYLASEVLAQQSPEMQRFLLGSSVLDQLYPDLCDELLETQNSAELLRTIEERNLFITRLEDAHAVYRYHHLFQEYLQSHLSESDPTRWQDLQRGAAKAFEARGAWDQAIAHHLKAQAFDDAARVIETIAKETFEGGRWFTLARWIDALPPETLEAHPDLIVSRAMVFDQTGELNQASKLYSRALKLFERGTNLHGVGRTLIKQALNIRFQGRYQDAIENCLLALDVLNHDEWSEIAEAHRIMGISYAFLGELRQSIDELDAALKLYGLTNDVTRIALTHHDLGVATRRAGKAGAQEHFYQALNYWRRANNAAHMANTLNSIGVSYHREGNYAKAIETLEQARDEAHRSGQLRVEAFALASLGDVHRDKGESLRARQAYQAAYDIARRINEGFTITYALNALGETMRAAGDLTTAEQLIHQAIEQAESHHSSYELGLTMTALGILSLQQGNMVAAIDHLAQAVELLDRGGAKRDSARAHLHLAHAYFLQHKYRQVSRQLRITAEVGVHLREDQFIVADGKQLLPLIKYAASKKLGDGYFVQVAEKLKSLPAPAAGQEEVEKIEVERARLEARAFGVATVMASGRPISTTEWDSAATRELFFLLLAHPQGLRKEQIIDSLWGEMTGAKANGVFHSTVYRMRHAVAPDCLVFEDGLYRINPDLNLKYDVAQFTESLRQAGEAATEIERANKYRQAIELAQGDYFEDSYSDWCLPIRTELRQKHLDALFALASYHANRGEVTDAFALFRRILEKDSCREDVYRALMRLNMKVGDRAGALKTYRDCVHVLKKEMDIEPSPETKRLHRQILTGKIPRRR